MSVWWMESSDDRKPPKSNRFKILKQNNNFARALHFFVLFFAVTTTLLRRENTYFHVLSTENVNKRGGNILSLKFPYTFSIVAKNPISEAQEVVFIFFCHIPSFH